MNVYYVNSQRILNLWDIVKIRSFCLHIGLVLSDYLNWCYMYYQKIPCIMYYICRNS